MLSDGLLYQFSVLVLLKLTALALNSTGATSLEDLHGQPELRLL
jgi:hypothetical protein